MASKFKRNIFIGFGLSLLLLIISSVASFVSIQNLVSSAGMVDHTHQVITGLEKINTALTDAETSQRGYLLTGDSAFLQPFQLIADEVRSGIDLVQQQTKDNIAQQKNIETLKQLAYKRLEYLKGGITIRQKGESVTAATLINGKRLMDEAREVITALEQEENRLLVVRTASQKRFSEYTPVLIVIAALLSLLITGVFYIRIINDFRQRARLQEELQQKDREISRRLEVIQNIADKISGGNYTIRVDDAGKDLLGNLSFSLNKMAESLDYSFSLLSDKEWLQAGIAELNQQMLGEQQVEALASGILEYAAGRTRSQVGAFYLSNHSGYLELAGRYGLSDAAPKEIRSGEGLVGQCALKGKIMIVDGVKADHFAVSFASGNLTPAAIILIPIYHERTLKGVIELGSIHEYSPNEKLFLESLSEHTGIVIDSSQRRRKLQELLEETQTQSEELQVQHNELENINEELKAQSQKLQVSEEELKVQQEELMQTNQELEERTTLLEEKNQLIEERNQEIQMKARELAASTKYKSEFLANMSHELRTPLNSILLLSRLMAENNEKNLSGDQIEYAQVIQSSGQGLLSLIDEILDLSKIESGKMEMEYGMISVREIADDMKSLFSAVAKEKKLDFRIDLSSGIPAQIETDKLRIEQIIKNLVSNALKFTSKGYVKLSVALHASDPSIIGFSVKDTGIGIDKEKQSLIFEAFQQADGSTRRQYGGTGLGLSISRELARLLGGHIVLTSEAGRGSDFTLFVPLVRPQYLEMENELPEIVPFTEGLKTNHQPAQEEPGKTSVTVIPEATIADDRHTIVAGDKTILIVEDDTNFAKTLLNFARKGGYKGIVATRGDEGVELAQLLRPMGILLDIKLPVKDGWEVMKELKDNVKTRSIPVHIMSSHEVKHKSISSGAVDFINKPLALEKMHEIFKKIEDVLSQESKKVLIVEENSKHAQALSYFLENFSISSEISSTVADGIRSLQKDDVNCVIMDIGIGTESSLQSLEQVKRTPGLEKLPVIIFTGKSLSLQEEAKIKQYADSIVVKTAHSYQRILDEVSLFLHLVEEHKIPESGGTTFRKLGGLNEVLKNKKVLIADDDVRNIFSLTKALENFGMTVLSAIDGKEALSQLKEDPSVDIILMDMMMPEMDGYETMKRIRNMPGFSKLPIISVTAKAMAGDREKCISSGASDYITKPIDTDQLLSLLRVWLYDRI